MQIDADELTTCVRRFGRAKRGHGERKGAEHVTGARMSSSNGHEVKVLNSMNFCVLISHLGVIESVIWIA